MGFALLTSLAIASADVMLGPGVHLAGLLIAGPLIISARSVAARTAMAGIFAVVLATMTGVLEQTLVTADHVVHTVTVMVGGVFATIAAHVRGHRESELSRLADLSQVAEVAQRALLRPIPARVGGLAFAHRYRSAARQALIGGDLFDVAFTPFGVRLIIGDVKGKGLQAVSQAADVLRSFREAVFHAQDLVDLAKAMDRRLGADLDEEDFVTVLLAEFAPGLVRLVNCGHHPPVRIGHRLDVLCAPDPAPPLGLDPDPTMITAIVGGNQRLLFYTDGLVEARDPGGQMFALDERVRACLTRPQLEDALQGVHDMVLAHARGDFDDDLALVLCQPEYDHSGAAQAWPRSPVTEPAR
ncbi:PP2C family protein-serine/threonine phosphatase [Nonomuraea soli]|uniref:Serine phosphatase RsbU (Regulator of sigma subunit) n=1 Tax=Nonomuraea soli TaxID=1032476 RepID=A0A7W0CM89_9ACTN|nr:PP2C family protein-serine/threonine phosphatase [Nonomuraea soli]MBA2893764.1 serine phosphatase RsbU (regulator of sigma subunit) [Nonomuraea soli]